jgi:hypothetical protein
LTVASGPRVTAFVARPKVAHNLLWMYRDGNEVKERGGEIKYKLHSLQERKPLAAVAHRLGIQADRCWPMANR